MRLLRRYRGAVKWFRKVWCLDPGDPQWFTKECDKHRSEWEAAVQEALQEAEGELTRHQVAKELAADARTAFIDLQVELNLMLVRTSILVAAATLLFAVYALKPAEGDPGSLAFALGCAGIAFMVALVPTRPPFIRAWRQKYEKRHKWTLLTPTPYKKWVMDCWRADRISPVIQGYKMAHAVAVPLLIAAAGWSAIGLAGVFQ